MITLFNGTTLTASYVAASTSMSLQDQSLIYIDYTKGSEVTGMYIRISFKPSGGSNFYKESIKAYNSTESRYELVSSEFLIETTGKLRVASSTSQQETYIQVEIKAEGTIGGSPGTVTIKHDTSHA